MTVENAEVSVSGNRRPTTSAEIPALSDDEVAILRRQVEGTEDLDVILSRTDALRLLATLDADKSAPTSYGPASTFVRAGDPAEPRELVGRLVRQVWVQWAQEQPDPKPSWLVGWDELDDGQREVDMRIGKALFGAGYRAGRVIAGERLGSLLRRAADGEDPAALYTEAVTFDAE